MPVFDRLNENLIYSDGWKSYDGLVDHGAKTHYRIKRSKNKFVEGKTMPIVLRVFWAFSKDRLSEFKGIKREHFLLHLKECGFRYKKNL